MSRRYLPIPRKRSEPRPNRNDAPEYLNFIRSLPCAVCARLRSRQFGRTESAHVGQRGLGQKCSDWGAIPLCACHHRTGEYAHHRIGKRFWTVWNMDRQEVIGDYREKYESSRTAPSWSTGAREVSA
jgi:hypothetical protein